MRTELLRNTRDIIVGFLLVYTASHIHAHVYVDCVNAGACTHAMNSASHTGRKAGVWHPRPYRVVDDELNGNTRRIVRPGRGAHLRSHELECCWQLLEARRHGVKQVHLFDDTRVQQWLATFTSLAEPLSSSTCALHDEARIDPRPQPRNVPEQSIRGRSHAHAAVACRAASERTISACGADAAWQNSAPEPEHRSTSQFTLTAEHEGGVKLDRWTLKYSLEMRPALPAPAVVASPIGRGDSSAAILLSFS